MKVQSKFYRGIEFVSISELPADQQLLLQTARSIERIKILADGKLLSNCIQYRHYCEWYASVFEVSAQETAGKVIRQGVLSLTNA